MLYSKMMSYIAPRYINEFHKPHLQKPGIKNDKRKTNLRKYVSELPLVEPACSLYSIQADEELLMANQDLDKCARLLADIMNRDRGDRETVKFKLSRVNNQTVSSKAKAQKFKKKKNIGNVTNKKQSAISRSVPRLCNQGNHAVKQSEPSIKQQRKKTTAGSAKAANARPTVVIPTAESSTSSIFIPNDTSPRQLNHVSKTSEENDSTADSYVVAPVFNQRLMSSTPQLIDLDSETESHQQGHTKFTVYSTKLPKPQDDENYMYKAYHAAQNTKNTKTVGADHHIPVRDQTPANSGAFNPMVSSNKYRHAGDLLQMVSASQPGYTKPLIQQQPVVSSVQPAITSEISSSHLINPHYAMSQPINSQFPSYIQHHSPHNVDTNHQDRADNLNIHSSLPPQAVPYVSNAAFQKEIINDKSYDNFARQRTVTARTIPSSSAFSRRTISTIEEMDKPERDDKSGNSSAFGIGEDGVIDADPKYSLYSSVGHDSTKNSCSPSNTGANHIHADLSSIPETYSIDRNPVNMEGNLREDTRININGNSVPTGDNMSENVTLETPPQGSLTLHTEKPALRQVQFEAAAHEAGGAGMASQALVTPPSSPVQRDSHGLQAHPRKASPGSVKANQRTLSYLLKELRAVSSISGEVEVRRLVGEVEQAVQTLQPSRLARDLQTEIDLGLQPLRSENAQLRRRLRILNQQLKDFEKCEKKDAETTDTSNSVEFAQLQALNASLQKQVRDERARKDLIVQKFDEIQRQCELMRSEKVGMMEALSLTESELIKCKQDCSVEMNKMEQEMKMASAETDRVKRHLEAGERDRQISNITLQQKDREIARLEDLVRGLQQSMTSLLLDMESCKPAQDLSRLPASVDMHELSRLLDDQQIPPKEKENLPPPSKNVMPLFSPFSMNSANMTQTTLTGKTSTTPARRSLDFDEKMHSTYVAKQRLQTLTEEALDRHNHGNSNHSNELDAHDDQDVNEPLSDMNNWGDFLKHLKSKLDYKHKHVDTDNLVNKPLINNYTNYLSESEARSNNDHVARKEHKRDPLSSSTAGFHRDGITAPTATKAISATSSMSSLDDKLTAEMESNFSGLVISSRHTPHMNEKPVANHNSSSDTSTVESRSKAIDLKRLPENVKLDEQAMIDNTQIMDTISVNQSRYSVTDYFRKYPQSAGVAEYSGFSTGPISEERTPQSELKYATLDDTSFTHKESNSNYDYLQNHSGSRQLLQQNATFQGTQLDTSVSAIDDTQSVATESTVSTAWTVDDQAFRKGLASLDANIARIQQKLRENNFSH